MDVAGQAARDRDAVGFLAVILGDLERWRDTAAADAQQAGTEAGREFARGEAHGFRTAAGLVAAGLARAQGPRDTDAAALLPAGSDDDDDQGDDLDGGTLAYEHPSGWSVRYRGGRLADVHDPEGDAVDTRQVRPWDFARNPHEQDPARVGAAELRAALLDVWDSLGVTP